MKKVLSILLCIFWMGFIFYNSCQDGTESNVFTKKIVDKIITISEKIQEEDTQNIKVYASPNMAQVLQDSNPEGISVTSTLKRIASQDKVTLNKEIRKAAHAFEFLVLAVLLCNAFFVYGFKGKKAIIYILFIVLLYAVLDEFHQIYVVGRGSSVKDVLIDFIGGILGIDIYYIFYYSMQYFGKKFKRKRRKNRSK